jgi:N-acetyl-anhydromuramyl-L-alanine amidase AmpD
MDYRTAQITVGQLYLYSQDTARFLGVPFEQRGKNSYGLFESPPLSMQGLRGWGGMPCGAIQHYTASNAAYSKKRPYGRYPVLRTRFARGSRQGVGVHFIIWDSLIPRFKEFQDRYPMLVDMPAEVAFMGDDQAFWHAGSANRWAYGIEIRNLGKLTGKGDNFFWSRGRNRYHGRKPIKVGNSWWEPYTRVQMEATLWVNRLMCALHPIGPERFLGHTHVSNTRIDPGPHFPIHEMRRYSIEKSEVPMSDVEFLREFQDDSDLADREDIMISEVELHAGKYRHDWDGRPDDWDERLGTAPKLAPDTKADRDNYSGMLESLGYYVSDKTLADTVAIFRSRWKERRPSRRGFRNMITAGGGMNKQALGLLSVMARQCDRL